MQIGSGEALCEIRTMADQYIEWIRSGLKRTGKTQSALAAHLGLAHPQITQLLKGKRDLKVRELPKIAEFLGVPPPEAEHGGWSVNVVGYVGAGAEVHPFDDFAQGAGLETVEVDFPVRAGTVAVIVRGDSMLPIFEDGDLIGYMEDSADPRTLIGKTCIVRLVDGRTFIKKLKRGSDDGLFTLVSANASDIEDVELEWARRYRFHIPADEWRSLTK